MSEFIPTWKQPSHPESLQVIKGATPFTASARSLVALPAGALFSKITTAIPAPQKTYTSVQTGPGLNIELCSDLVYCNHSCSPSLEFDMSTFEVRVARDRPLSVGDELTFFYPSTEWDMVQPFNCFCGSQNCLGLIAGSQDMGASVLSRYWLNPHVKQLLEGKQMMVEATETTEEISLKA
ncbi:hypothetical protein BDV36DRAFT_296322 [Aspergillus pseudocaelatus]|uniref:Post-SET domain-containing protein n=1 Tax=Aspergillus pseudocaelatus TaxID=1825620 RepID=A0ABQ6WJN0_9EURO|nr:hypothetical protein BDV36DRAFT_296322 [Aspergillus pseudocaelatus]